MKKTLVALAALAATSAFAQSSVSIDGVANYGVKYAVGSAVATDGWKGDRNALNFRVVEDMGAGDKFSLLLNMRYNPANAGASSTYVNSATGNLGDNLFEQTKFTFDTSYGQLALGRFTNAQGVADLHPLEDAGQSTASHQAINGRHSGQIQYTTPDFMGAKLWVLGAKATSNKYLGGGNGGGYLAAWDLSTVAPGTAAGTNGSTTANPDARHRDLNAVGVDYKNGPLYVHANQMTDLTNTKSTKIGATYDLGYAKFYANQYNQKDNISYYLNTAVSYAAGASNTTTTTAATTSGTGAGQAKHKATELAVKVPYGKFNFVYGRYAADADLKLGVTDGSTKTTRNAYAAFYDITKRTSLIAAVSNTQKGDGTFFKSGHNGFFGVQHTY